MKVMVKKNAEALEQELNWLQQIIDIRIKSFFNLAHPHASIYDIEPPDISKDESFYAEVLKRDNVSLEERIVLLLSLAPHIRPELFDVFLVKNNAIYDKRYTEFGGLKDKKFDGFIPTGETAAFLLAGKNLEKRFNLFNLFCDEHYFNKRNILYIVKPKNYEPYLSGAIILSLEYLSYLTVGVSKFTAPAAIHY
ncbi:MAG: ATP-binding protein, partial [Chitinophagaceae bacterium]